MKAKSRKEREYGNAADHAAKHGKKGGSVFRIPDGVHLWEPKKGANLIDIGPYEVKRGSDKKGGNPHAKTGQVWYERTYYVYTNLGPERLWAIAPIKMGHPTDCVAVARKKLQDKPEDPDASENEKKNRKAAIGALYPKERQLFWIFDHAEPDKGWQLWDISFHNFGTHLNDKIDGAEDDKKERWGRFFHPTKGLSLRIVGKEETFMGKKYLEFKDIEFKKREEQYTEELLDELQPLDDLLIETDPKELKAMFQASDDDDDDSDEDEGDEEESPRRKKSSRKDEDDDEDDDDEDLDEDDSDEDEDDDEEDEKPRKKPSKKPSRKDDDDDGDDDEDDEDDDDDEDEKPRKKPSKKPSRKDEDDEDDSDDDEDEDEDEDDDDDDDDEDEKPSKKPSKKPSARDDDDDDIPFDDDDEDEDEDEDEKPRRRKK